MFWRAKAHNIGNDFLILLYLTLIFQILGVISTQKADFLLGTEETLKC